MHTKVLGHRYFDRTPLFKALARLLPALERMRDTANRLSLGPEVEAITLVMAEASETVEAAKLLRAHNQRRKRQRAGRQAYVRPNENPWG